MKRVSIAFLIALGVFTMLCNIGYTKEKLQKATFAGGCFWCMESPFEELDGVREVKEKEGYGEYKKLFE